jgi:hypothetical protein
VVCTAAAASKLTLIVQGKFKYDHADFDVKLLENILCNLFLKNTYPAEMSCK